MEESTDAAISFSGDSDIYKQLVHRYNKSVVPKHRQLCKTATAIHSTIKSESLPFTPLSYFTTIIEALSATSTTHDADAVSGLSSFLEIVLPLVTEKPIETSKASEAAKVLVELVDYPCEGLLVSSVRALVKCLGVLLEFCNLDDWESFQLGFETLMKYSIHKRPKVRQSAHHCVVKVFQSSPLKESASKLVLNFLKTRMSLADGSRSEDESKVDKISKCEHLEVLHMLDLLKSLIPCLPRKYISEAIKEIQKCSSLFTKDVLDALEEILRFIESKSELTLIHTVKIANEWNEDYSLVIVFITGLLTCESTATRASNILKEMMNRVAITRHVDDDDTKESIIVRSFCQALLDVLSTQKGTPNEYILAVISILFQHLGIYSQSYMGSILVKLSDFRTVTSGDVKHLEECIGSAVIGMGPDKVLAVLPISINASDLSCCNTWLIHILEEYMIESSLGLFMDMIVPLASSFEEACQQVGKNSEIGEQLHSYAREFWGLLPAFCRHPVDMDENFGSLVKLLMSFIKKDAFMLEDIAVSFQHLVRRNKNKSFVGDDKASKHFNSWYTETYASGNIKAVSESSEQLLKAFTKVFLEVSPEKRAFIKDTIGCLAPVTEYSAVEAVFLSSLRKNTNRCPILELASAFVDEAGIDPTDFIHTIIEECLQDKEENRQSEAYARLEEILVECLEFRSSRFVELVDLLIDLKSPVEISSLKLRFSCFKSLLVQSFEISYDGENTYGFPLLKEIIATLQDSNVGRKKVAEEIFLETSSLLQKTGPYYEYEFISMITRHLSGYSSYITSCGVYALSLILNDFKIWHVMPNLVQEILELLDDEDIQVSSVLVLNIEVEDLHNILSDILLSGFLPWLSVFQHYGIEKLQMRVILKTMMLRCGYESVTSLVPEKYRDVVNGILENEESLRQRGKKKTFD